MTNYKKNIANAIGNFNNKPLRPASIALFQCLGYQSDKTIEIDSIQDFCDQCDPQKLLEHPNAYLKNWKSVELLFQLTDEELSGNTPFFKNTSVKTSILQSYVFFAIELEELQVGEGNYSRSKLAGITRQINRIFPMPVMVLFKIGNCLSIALINRRQNKRDDDKDVLGKVTLIKNIAIDKPHPGHLDILASFALQELSVGSRIIQNFDQLHAAWEAVFNVELLNKRFYEELSNWYFWARKQVNFPADLEPDERTRNATSVIRLLTRLIFCWFLKEKNLIPKKLFLPDDIKQVLVSLDENDSSYFHAILQNLFFATLNQPMNVGESVHRQFATNGSFQENRNTYGVKTLYRYENYFREPEKALSLFEDIPFLNGGLFACLDVEDDNGKVQYADGFSRNPKKQAVVPNRLFFSESHIVDLSGKDDFGDTKKKKAKIRGLLHILNGYQFTMAESTPVEQEIALDPELLGNVFENLLASYNPETGESARKQTGSFYTPRPIVDHMVDEALKAYLSNATGLNVGLDNLFAYTEEDNPFTETESDALIAAIDACNILDPACGSGAYPMGILHKLVFVLGKLDDNNEKWRQRQIDKAEEIEDVEARESAILAINREFSDNALDYGRKLYLIENCIYGADIQPIAIQIAKLRFFISLICDQKTSTDRSRNLGIRPLPNLETKFVAANTLISLETKNTNSSMANTQGIKALKKQLSTIRHRYFSAQTRDAKRKLQKQDDLLRQKILKELTALGYGGEEEQKRINWNPYNHHSVAEFFDPLTMFGPDLAQGFDVVIGNPPYVQIQKFNAAQKQTWQAQNYSTYAATGDIYCLFYERGVRLLKAGGQLSFITSNKWMRAGYGESLRRYLTESVEVKSVIDFGMAQNFGAATTYTCIVHAVNQKPVPSSIIRACYVTNDIEAMRDPGRYLIENAVERKDFAHTPWVLLSSQRFRIQQAVAAQGVPLTQWHIQINYGVKTGYNEAFYITSQQREAFIAQDPSCKDLIVPLLRGRDIERYGTQWQELEDEKWMLFIPWHFPLHQAGSETGSSARAEALFAAQYPSIYKHLLSHKENLSKRNQAETGIRYEWYALQRWASDYHNDFKKPKIIYPNMTKYLPFYLDTVEHFFINDKAFILTTEEESLPYLLSVLNSTLFRCCFKDNFPELMGNAYEIRKIFMDKIPIKKPTPEQTALFENLVPLVQAAKTKKHDMAADFLIEVMDACVMEVYFADHMAEKGLGIIQHVAALLPCASAQNFHQIANDSKHPIRNILLRIPADSPDWLAVIQREGAV